MTVEVLNRTKVRVPPRPLTKRTRRICALLARAGMTFPKDYVLSIALVGEKEMRRLNRTFRGKNAPATVLSFDYGGAGDLLLAPEAIRREARASGRSLLGVATRLVAHGALHLAGTHHGQSRRRTQHFEHTEQQLLKHLGIPLG